MYASNFAAYDKLFEEDEFKIVSEHVIKRLNTLNTTGNEAIDSFESVADLPDDKNVFNFWNNGKETDMSLFSDLPSEPEVNQTPEDVLPQIPEFVPYKHDPNVPPRPINAKLTQQEIQDGLSTWRTAFTPKFMKAYFRKFNCPVRMENPTQYQLDCMVNELDTAPIFQRKGIQLYDMTGEQRCYICKIVYRDDLKLYIPLEFYRTTVVSDQHLYRFRSSSTLRNVLSKIHMLNENDTITFLQFVFTTQSHYQLEAAGQEAMHRFMLIRFYLSNAAIRAFALVRVFKYAHLSHDWPVKYTIQHLYSRDQISKRIQCIYSDNDVFRTCIINGDF